MFRRAKSKEQRERTSEAATLTQSLPASTLPRQRMAVLSIFFFLLILLVPGELTAQRKDQLDRARREFAAGDYPSAIRTLQQVRKLEDDAEGTLLLAVARFHANDLLGAEADLLALLEREDEDYPLAWFYLGRVYHAQHRFRRAAVEYKRYLRALSGDGPERQTVVRLLQNVDNGIRAGFVNDEMIAENLGEVVNSEHDEYGPVPSPTGTGKVYFSRQRPDLIGGASHSDIVVVSENAGVWSAPAPVNPLLNTDVQETLIDLSPDGQQLYYYRGTDDRDGRYLLDVYQEGGTRLSTQAPDAPLSPAAGDVTPFFGAPDAVYFASRRPGGYGGLDLYRSERLPDGGYGPPQNLGPEVNGPYDEITPFVARDGRTLYFSTNDPAYSVGGFDVVRSFRVLGSDDRFVRPENAGMPLNSAGDDTHFRLAPDTFTGYLTSDRKDGYGQRDLYIVYFVEAREEMRPRK